MDMRNGKYTMDDALEDARANEARLLRLCQTSNLPLHGDWEGMSAWMCQRYIDFWHGYIT